MAMFVEMFKMLAIDAGFVLFLVLLVMPLVRYKHATFAVLKRNFVGYFSNPTGYVFLCLFVFLTSTAAFVPHEFFTSNLANLNQLNEFLPYIMLVFIPAITMSIWSEERRQGTDELLLTLPADDFDIVIGKYLAAAAIFTASLLFSQLSNYAVLVSLTLGDLDTGLFFTTYLGYWMIGLAMLSVGMAASFLTSNLTVGFILGALFNAPLVFASSADVIIPWSDVARVISYCSISAQFDSFGRGVISLASITYFVMIVVVGLYLSMVMIGRRHWLGGRDGHSLLGHYLMRTLALVTFALAANVMLTKHDIIHQDLTEGRVSSLSPDTLELVRNLETDKTIFVDAFVSGEVPEQYAKTKYNLITLLKEFESQAPGKLVVRIHNDLEPFSEEVALAEQRFGIRPQPVRTRSRGAIVDEELVLGAAFSCGLQSVVVPFFDYGVPVEYELVRSISTVAQAQRKKLGVVRTDAQLYGGFSFAGGQPQQIPKQAIVEELEKQYDVEEVDPLSPINVEDFDVLLAVQPSSLTPEGMENLLDAIRSGVPTAIFEDPLPQFMSQAPGTGQPKQPPGGMFMGGNQPLPKADIRRLWETLGITAPGTIGREGLFQPDIVWQQFDAYPKLQLGGIPDQWIFVRNEGVGSDDLLAQDNKITKGLDEIFLPFPGAIQPVVDVKHEQFDKLLVTREVSGTIGFQDLIENQGDPLLLRALQRRQGAQLMAVQIKRKVDYQPLSRDALESPVSLQADSAATPSADGTQRTLNVVYVADIDLMMPAFLRIRARPEEQEDIQWRFENVTFVLNAIDVLSGDDAYVAIRSRKTRHSTLKVVERSVDDAREKEFSKRVEFQEQFQKAFEKAEEENQQALKRFQDVIDDLQKRQREGQQINELELREQLQRLGEQQEVRQKSLEITRRKLERDRDRSIERIQRDVDLEIQKIQNYYKILAVFLPPIPPLLVGFVVLVRRLLREREGVERSRLR